MKPQIYQPDCRLEDVVLFLPHFKVATGKLAYFESAGYIEMDHGLSFFHTCKTPWHHVAKGVAQELAAYGRTFFPNLELTQKLPPHWRQFAWKT